MNIFFVCPDNNKPTGGIKQIYRQVDVLNEYNISAFVLHENYGFKCSWFENETKVAYSTTIFEKIKNLNANGNSNNNVKAKLRKGYKLAKGVLKSNKDIIIKDEDLFVFPEIYGPMIHNVLENNRIMIYNQGAYQTFFKYTLNESKTPYKSSKYIATIVNSDNALKYIQYAFPDRLAKRVKYGIDKKRFYFSKNKKKQIAFMPRRLRGDLIQVINLMRFKGLLEGWELLAIDKMTEDEVANNLRESAIFLGFSINEGFGMPPAEAMACGCLVIGYPGKGGEEFFKNEFSYPILDRNVLQFANTLEQILKNYDTNKQEFIDKGKLASEFILSEYAMEEEKRTIINAWNSIIKEKING